MPVEIERKFLVRGDEWRRAPGVRYRQAYLFRENENTARVRLAGEKAYLTIKGPTREGSRPEFEYEIPAADGEELIKLCTGLIIEKIRHFIDYQGFTWEVDEFLGENAGLVVAEIELKAVDQPFGRPVWVGKEVTGDPRYANASLAVHPFSAWFDRGSMG